jgi:hypothetical protein
VKALIEQHPDTCTTEPSSNPNKIQVGRRVLMNICWGVMPPGSNIPVLGYFGNMLGLQPRHEMSALPNVFWKDSKVSHLNQL